MVTAKRFIEEWTKPSEAIRSPKTPLSMRIPTHLYEQIESLADEFGIAKTDAAVSCLTVGIASFNQEKKIRAYLGLQSFEEFCKSNKGELGELLEKYEAYLAIGDEKRDELLENTGDQLDEELNKGGDW